MTTRTLRSKVGLDRIVAQRIREWEVSGIRQRERPAEAPSVPGPYVAISRAIGSRGQTIAALVAEKLSWDCYERQIVDYIAERAKVRADMVKSLGETRRDAVTNWVRSTLDHRHLPEDAYVRLLVDVICTIGVRGRAVILGRGAQFMLPPEAGLRVRLVAPCEVRVRNARESYGIDDTEARALISDSDRSQVEFYRAYFRADVNSALNYDLVLNVEALTPEAAASIIVCSLHAKPGVPPG
jgi:cytidylate kinase